MDFHHLDTHKKIALATLVFMLPLSASAESGSCENHYVQSFTSSIPGKARGLRDSLTKHGFPSIVSAYAGKKRTFYRVMSGPFPNRATVIRAQSNMKGKLRGNTSVQDSIVVRKDASCKKSPVQ